MDNRAEVVRGLSITNVVLGAWLIISPFIVYEFAAAELWNQVILGIIVAALALVRLSAPAQRWASTVNGVAGLWLIISPFLLGFVSASAYWNAVIVGILVAIVGFSNANIGAGAGHTRIHRAGV